MSEKCVHEWYYRIVDICSWQFFCIRCGEKLSMDKFSDHASDLEKRMAELGKATACISELEAAQRWIPVSERLPECEKDVLAFWGKALDGSKVDWFGTAWRNDSDDGKWCTDPIVPTHWMPLPEPPNDTQTDTVVYGKERKR